MCLGPGEATGNQGPEQLRGPWHGAIAVCSSTEGSEWLLGREGSAGRFTAASQVQDVFKSSQGGRWAGR